MTAKVVTNILEGKKIFCSLCFAHVEENAVGLQDEAFVNLKTSFTEEISKILEYILGEIPKVSSEDVICNSCIKSASESYRFIKMCKDNYECLNNIINSLNDCFENISDSLAPYKSLFVHVKTKDCSSKQYYDIQRSVLNRTSALTRFRSLVYGRYISRDKKSRGLSQDKIDISLKERRARAPNCNAEFFKICEIIKENNHSKFKCRVCARIFTKSFNFKKHYYSQHSAKLLKCKECGKSYGSESLLKQHTYDSHASIICSTCGKEYKNRYSLLYHMRQHSGEQPYTCQYCDMKFQWSSRRAEHIRRYHLEPSAKCDMCHIVFRSLSSLYHHRKKHFNPNSKLHVTLETPPVTEEEIVDAEVSGEGIVI